MKLANALSQRSELQTRIRQLEDRLAHTRNADQRCQLQDRIRMLSAMLREARELAVLT